MSAHTPGPWTVDADKHRGRGGERIFKVVTSGLIADVSAWWVDTISAEANARLIAAAPELLEVLRRIADAHYHGSTKPAAGCPGCLAEAAVAKAEGR